MRPTNLPQSFSSPFLCAGYVWTSGRSRWIFLFVFLPLSPALRFQLLCSDWMKLQEKGGVDSLSEEDEAVTGGMVVELHEAAEERRRSEPEEKQDIW